MKKQAGSDPLIFFFDVDGTLYDHFSGMQEHALDTLYTLKEQDMSYA